MKSHPILIPTLMSFALASVQSASAVTITAFEFIQDLNASGVDLRRTRWDGINSPIVEDNDAVIRAENGVSSAFGIIGPNDVRYFHHSDWLGVSEFTGASLRILARLVENGPGTRDNDNVRADGLPLGALRPRTSLTAFTISGVDINEVLQDDALTVTVRKSVGDSFELRSSWLMLTYEIPDSTPVPDGGSTIVLLSFALAGIAGLCRASVRERLCLG